MTVTTERELFNGYATAADHALRVVIEERIAELLRWRRWYRARPDWASFMGLAQQHAAELRALLRLRRVARRLAAPDPLTQAKGYADWTSGELVAGWGK
jgi:hypothetical protein